MARKEHLPADLTADQVVALQDALLANADRLLKSALATLDAGDAPLARSLGILAMEESGKAIALHERRIGMAYSTEGEPFVNDQLRGLWREHHLKLDIVHRFLSDEQYWFDTRSPDPAENAAVLGLISEWKTRNNTFKQRGFYVDVTPNGDVLTPEGAADPEAVRAVLQHVHQIGWQLRLGEHIEGRQQADNAEPVPPADEEEIEDTRRILHHMDPEEVERILESMRAGSDGKPINNAAYGFTLPRNPFENVGKPGYEAQDRELQALQASSDDEHTAND